jgi:hypothetical protein
MKKYTHSFRLIIYLFLTIGFNILTYKSHAQGYVTGKLMENNENGAGFATIMLLSVADSSMVKGAITNEEGEFRMDFNTFGNYFLKISYVGFNTIQTDPFEITASNKEYDFGKIYLSESALQLKEVTVTTQRKLIERKADRFVMDMEASTFQTSSVLEIFQATPFMSVKGTSITLNGKSNLMVLLDGVPVPGATLSSILENMIGNDILKIEFITNPSVQYDSSIDGVILITTKKGQHQGITGTLSGNFSQGQYGNGTLRSNITYKKEKYFIQGALNHYEGYSFQENWGYRILNLNGNRVVLNDRVDQLYYNRILSGQLRGEYKLNSKHSIGGVVDMINRNTTDRSNITSRTSFSNEINSAADSILIAPQKVRGLNLIKNYNLNYKGILDTLGKQVNVIFTYTPVSSVIGTEMEYQNIFGPDGTVLSQLPRVRNNNPSYSTIFVSQVDWQLPFSNNWKIDAGFKFTSSENITEPSQDEFIENSWLLTPEFTFLNVFKENIIAGYTSFQKQFNKTQIQAGVRVEKTDMQVIGEFNRDFVDFFPNIMVQRELNNGNQINFVYRKKIDRPSFRQLTPFRIYVDDFTIVEGNPALRPQYSDVITLNTTIKDIFLEAEYTTFKDRIGQFPMQNGAVTTFALMNLDVTNLDVRASYNYQLFPWWQTSINVQGRRFWSSGILQGENITLNGFAGNIALTNTFTLPSNLKLETFYSYASPEGFGMAITRQNNYTRIALRGNLLDKKLQYVLSLTDLFRGNIYGMDLESKSITSRTYSYYDSRRVQIGLIYTFGKKTVKAAPRSTLGNEDVINRSE